MIAVALVGFYLAGWVHVLTVPEAEQGSDWIGGIFALTMTGILGVIAVLAALAVELNDQDDAR